MKWDKAKKFVTGSRPYRHLRAFILAEDPNPPAPRPEPSNQPTNRADKIVERIKRRETIIHEGPATRGPYYSYPEDKKGWSWWMWACIAGLVIVMVGIVYLMAFPSEEPIPVTPTPTPIPRGPGPYNISLSVQLLNVPNAYNQRVIAIKHMGGDTITNISTLWVVPWPSEESGLPGGYQPSMDTKMLRKPFKTGDTIYLYLDTQHKFWLNASLPSYSMFVDIPNGDMKIVTIDGRYKTGLGDTILNVSNSMTYNVDNSTNIGGVIASSPAYSTLFVLGSLYQERLEITKPVRIISLNHGILDGGSLGAVISIKSSDVSISGFNIQNSGSGFADGGVVIYPNYANDVVSNNEISRSSVGVWLWGASNNQVISNNIHNNDKQGILLQNNAQNNTFRYNNVHDNGADGMTVDTGDNNNIIDNTFNNDKGYGINIPNYKMYTNVCEYNTGKDDFYCSDATQRGR